MTQRPTTDAAVVARFLERPNRFLIIAELDDGSRVRAYLPNTGRLEHLAIPGKRFVLRRDGVPPRVTEYTATRAWDGCWVALEASRAPSLLTDWLLVGNPLPGFGEVMDIRREVSIESHRLDLLVTASSGPVWVEVKSAGRAIGGTALLSRTPSARGVSHLEVLARVAQRDEAAAAAFVVQRGDARSLCIGGDADPGWIGAVRAAAAAGVTVVAYGCEVTETEVRIAGRLPITWEG